MRKMDNYVSHRFDLQIFLTARDILSDRQLVFHNINELNLEEQPKPKWLIGKYNAIEINR
jgi:hypothetical protein